MRFVGSGLAAAAIGTLLWASTAAGRTGEEDSTRAADGTDWARCLNQTDPVDCALRHEARLLASLRPATVQRSGTQLQFHWPQRPPLTLSPGNPADRYVLLGTLGPVTPRTASSWLVAQWTPVPTYWLVAPGNPSPLPLAGPPRLAPQGRLALVVSDATRDRTSGDGVDLWQRAGERWSRIFHFQDDAGGHFEFISWRADGAAARLKWHAPATGQKADCTPTTLAVQLRDGPYGWDFTPTGPWPVCAAEARQSSSSVPSPAL